MTLKRIVLVMLMLLVGVSSVYADSAPDGGKSLSVRSFQFKHKDADKAAAAIKALMSAEGSVSIQPATNSLVVTDHPENLKAIGVALQKFDTPPQSFHLVVRLVAASRVDASQAAKVDDELKDVAQNLAMMRYNSFEALGDATVESKEGDPGLVDLPTGYRADYRLGDYDPASDSIKVTDFKLSRFQADKGELTPLIKTTLNLKLGRTVILGAAKLPQSQRALMIVVQARR